MKAEEIAQKLSVKLPAPLNNSVINKTIVVIYGTMIHRHEI